MKLIIGNTSQISHYFPDNYIKISSRQIPNDIFEKKYQEVHLPFGLNVKGLEYSEYEQVNYYYTLDVMGDFLKISDKVIIYSTCELWSNCWGKINLNTPFNFHSDPYILSKWKLVDKIKSINNKKIITIYPFNFNSVWRNNNFLFGKIFSSIINKKNIEIGDTYFFRDLLHTSYVANICQKLREDTIIGSGRMFYVNDFIRDLYKSFNMDYTDWVTENFDNFKYLPKNEYYVENHDIYTYDRLLCDTLSELKKRFL